MKNLLFRGICLMLILALALSMTACGGTETPDTTVAPDTTEAPTTTVPEAPVLPDVTVENPVTNFSMNLGQTFDSITTLTAYANEDGSAHVEYVGAEKRVGDFDGKLFHVLAQKTKEFGLAALNGQDVYEDGEASGSMYIEFEDGTSLIASFYGTIAEEFTTAFTAMDAYFQELTASLPVYVPQAQVVGEVNPDVLAAMQEILNNSGMEGLDTMVISDVPLNENFGYAAGLSGSEGITNATSCSAMMMTDAFSFVIVTVEDEGRIADVRADFENTMDWRKWVCVAPTNALIAQKGSMVLCVMGDDLQGITTAAENAGWTDMKNLNNPDMQ